MKLNRPIPPEVWAALGFPQGWGDTQQEIGDTVHFVVSLPNGQVAEALIAEREGAPGFFRGDAQGPVAAQNTHLRLFNPANSGVDLLVDQFSWGRGAALANTLFSIRTGGAAGALVGAGFNKEIGGAVGKGELWSGSTAAPAGTVIGYFSAEMGVITFADAIRIPPGADLSFVQQVVNTDINGLVYWREVPA